MIKITEKKENRKVKLLNDATIDIHVTDKNCVKTERKLFKKGDILSEQECGTELVNSLLKEYPKSTPLGVKITVDAEEVKGGVSLKLKKDKDEEGK
jgi:hypothetical protein